MSDKYYRILNTSTGLYSKGGSYPRFSKKGKVWAGMGPLKNHIALIRNGKYDECVLIEYELTVNEVLSIADLINERKIKAEKKKADRLEKDR